jgi:hypothetical protein
VSSLDSPDDLRACLARLRRAGDALAALPLTDLLGRFAQLARLWRPDGDYARQARDLLGGAFQPCAVSASLDALAASLDAGLLERFLAEELGRADLLDTWRPDFTGAGLVRGFPLGVVAHVLAGNVFLGGAMAIAQALLTRNAVLLKASRDEAGFTALFAGSLAEGDADGLLSQAIALTHWDSVKDEFNEVLRREADAIVVWGGEQAIAAYPSERCKGRVIHHGPRLGVGVVLEGADESALDALAWDVCLWEQRACSSPRLLFVEGDAGEVARQLSSSLAAMNDRLPVKPLSLDDKSEVLTVRERAYWCDGAEVFAPPGSMAHTVLLAPSLPSAVPVGSRTVVVCPLRRLADVVDLVAPYRPMLQTAVLVAPPDRWPEAASKLVRAGFTQIAAAGSAASRFLGLPHEGEFALRRLVRLVGIDLGAGPLVYPDRDGAGVGRIASELSLGGR